MKRIFPFLLAVLMLFSVSCGKVEEKRSEHTFFVMDTFLTITLQGGKDHTKIFGEVNRMVTKIEAKASRTKEDSEVSAFNRAKESFTFSPEIAALIGKALTMSEKTEGAYDITVAPLVDLWNIKDGGPMPSEDALSKAREAVSYRYLTLEGNTLTKSRADVMIDLGSIAKGYAIDEVVTYLEEQNLSAIVNFGGNVALVGDVFANGIKVHLRDPFDATAVSGYFTLSTGVVAVSGDYERYFEENGVRYHHILSPFDGLPSRNAHSVAVYAENAVEADMLSTALFVMGKEKAEAFSQNADYDFAFVMTLSENEIFVSEGAKTIYTP